MPGDRKAGSSSGVGFLIIGGILVSFVLGGVFFLTIAQQRTGDAIPPDAAPNYFIEDASPEAPAPG